MTDSILPHHTGREDARRQVLETASSLFRARGIRSVTMDDIARELTMSKRTLYQLFSDKEDLLLACIVKHDQEEQMRLRQQARESADVLDFLLTNYSEKMRKCGGLTPQFVADLPKYKRVMQYIAQKQAEQEDEAVDFLNRGKEVGYFREEINFRVVYRQMVAIVNNIIADEELLQYTHRELVTNSVIVFLRGCATAKGVARIDEAVAQMNS